MLVVGTFGTKMIDRTGSLRTHALTPSEKNFKKKDYLDYLEIL